MKNRWPGRMQTALIFLLTLSLAALTFALWLHDDPVRWDSAGPAAAAARLLGLVTPEPESIVVSRDLQYNEAARPNRIVWTTEQLHWGAQWDAALVDNVYDQHLKSPLGDAMGSAKPAGRRTIALWRHALTGDSLYVEFPSPLPLRALALWLSVEAPALRDIPVRRLALSFQEEVTFWYIDERDGVPYECQTALIAREMPSVDPSGLSLRPCRFGFEDPASFERTPHALLFDETPCPADARYTPATLRPPDTDAFLRTLQINPDTPARYDREGVTTYLDDTLTRTCRFSPGTIHYQAPLDPFDQTDLSPAPPRTYEAIEQSRALLSTLSLLLGEARFSLDKAAPSPDGSVTVTFTYELNGLPVHLADEKPPAELVFREGQLIQADVRVLTFSLGNEGAPLLPEGWMYLLLSKSEGDFELRISYGEEGGGLLTADWEYN